MRAEELRELLDRCPFDPIRLHLSSGEHVDVRHPEMAIVSRSLVAIGVAGKRGVADHIVHYNLLHVVKIKPINGETRRRGRTRNRRPVR